MAKYLDETGLKALWTKIKALVASSAGSTADLTKLKTDVSTLDSDVKSLNDSLTPLIGKNIITANTDLNDYTTTGFYYFAAAYVPLNIPIGTNGFLVVLNNQSTATKQIWSRFGTLNSNDHQTYIRTGYNGSWSNWTKIITQKDMGTT